MRRYPLISLLAAFASGIIASDYFPFQPPFLILLSVLLLFLISAVTFTKLKQYAVSSVINAAALIILFFSLGAFNFSIDPTKAAKDFIPFDQLDRIKASGIIKDVSLLREKKFEVTLEIISVEGISVSNTNNSFLVRLNSKSIDSIKYLNRSLLPGDIVEVTGKYRKPPGRRNPGEFDYRKYLNCNGITGFVYVNNPADVKTISQGKNFFSRLINQWRKEIGYRIDLIHDRQTAGFLKGLLLGDRSQIDSSMMRDFMETGLVHIIAISGLHIVVIAYILFLLLQRFPLPLRYGLTSLSLLLFMFLTGAPPPVVRAVIMALIGISAVILNRSKDILNIVALTAMVSLIISPGDLFTPGFQLSYGAVLGLVLIFPEFRSKFIGSKKLPLLIKWTAELVLATISAQLMILPITHYYFGIFSLLSIPANVIAVPLSNFLVANGIITVLFSFISSGIAQILGYANDLMTFGLFWIVRFSGGFDLTYIPVHGISIVKVILLGTSLMIFVYFLRKTSTVKPVMGLTLTFIAVLTVFSSGGDELLEKGKLNLLMIDVGQGDAFLFRTPDNQTILIDGGKADENFNTGERVILPLLDRLGIDKIDFAVISHNDADHFGGLTALGANNRIRKVIISPVMPDDADGLILKQFFNSCGAEVIELRDTALEIGGMKLFFLGNQIPFDLSRNDRGLVVKIQYGKTGFLFSGDAGLKREAILAGTYAGFLDSDILKVSHHGSKTGTGKKFLELVTPSVSLISAGANNFYGHPSAEVLKNLNSVKSKVFRTDLEGAALIISDGEKIYRKSWL